MRVAVPVAAALLLVSCDKLPSSRTAATDPNARCASAETAEALKKIVFDEAAVRTADANKLPLADLARESRLSLEMPVVDEVDKDTGRVSCSGRLQLRFPDSARDALNTTGSTLDVQYSVQPAADASGVVYKIVGADGLIDGIAAADLSLWSVASRSAPPAEPAPETAAPAAAPAPSAAAPTPARAAPAAAAAPPPSLSADELIRRDARLSARNRALDGLLENASVRDPSGGARREHASALARRAACRDTACLARWFDEREASLSQWQ